MSIAGYLTSHQGELRLHKQLDPKIQVDGPVLEGRQSVEEALSAKGAAAPSRVSETLPRHPFCAGLLERVKEKSSLPTYGRIAEYDPVLRKHCRLDE